MAKVAPGVSTIFVGFRNTKPTVGEMREIFSKHGTITGVKMYAKFCFIEYDSKEAAEVAVAAENGSLFKDVRLEVLKFQKREHDMIVANNKTTELTRAHRRNIARNRRRRAKKAYKVAVSKSEESPSASVIKLKKGFLATYVFTKEAAISFENAQSGKEYQAQTEMLEDVSSSNEAPHLWLEPESLECHLPDETVAEAHSLMKLSVSKSEESPSASVIKLKKGFLATYVFTKEAAISFENAQSGKEYQAQAEMLEDVSSSNEAPHLWLEPESLECHLPDETVAEAHSLMKLSVSKSEESPSASVIKLKKGFLATYVFTKEAAISFENAQSGKEYQAQAEMLEDVSSSNEAPHLWLELPQLSSTQRHRIAWKNRRRANKADKKAVKRSFSPESLECHLPDETVAEAHALMNVSVSKLEEGPSASVIKLKKGFLATYVFTKEAAISFENAQSGKEYQAQAEMLEDVSSSNEAPDLWLDLPQLSGAQRRRIAWKNRRRARANKAYEKEVQRSQSPESLEHHLLAKSRERYLAFCSELQTRPEDKLSSDHAHRSSSASLSHCNQPLNSYGPISAHPDYEPKSLPTAHSQQHSSTTYGWSGWSDLSAEQTYTTAYPHPELQSYSSSYTAECSQVNAYWPGTSFYGSHEETDVHTLNRADDKFAQSVQPWNDAQIIQEGYSMQGNPSGLNKGDRPHLPDLCYYPSVLSVAKSSTSDLIPRESRDVGYGSSVESGKISMSRETTSSPQIVSSIAEYQAHERSESGIEQSGMCQLIITESNLRQYGLKVASKIHSVGLKVEICNLPPGMTIIEEVEDALIRGILFAVVITQRNVEHNSVTVNVLHGVAKEHRNMVLDDAVRLIASSYQDYMAAKRADAKSSAVSGPTKSKADGVPVERTQMLIKGLARNQHLTYEELEEIDIYLRKRQKVLRKESNVPSSLSGQSTAPKQQEDSVDVKLQKKLEATISSILKGESPVQQQATSAKPKHPGSYPPSGHFVDSGEPYVSNDYRRY